MIQRTPVLPAGVAPSVPSGGAPVPFPFGVEFQTKLIKVLMLDDASELIMDQVKANYFETPELRWIFLEIQTYWKAYNSMPSWLVLRHRAQSADSKLRPTILLMLDYQETLPVLEEAWIRAQILRWVKQNVFWVVYKETTALWNNGKQDEAMDHMSRAIDTIDTALWKHVDRAWFFDELPARDYMRVQKSVHSDAIPTGIKELDDVLSGGLSPGELGIWIAYAKGGKSTMLVNHGAMAVRAGFRNVLHIVLEGSSGQIQNKYDAWFADDFHNNVKHGGMSTDTYKQLFEEYQYYKGMMVIRGMTDAWTYTALQIEAEIKDLRKTKGWIPKLIIVDYGDLVKGREGPYAAEWMSSKDAFRDLKIISNRGYAVWTASQANFPDMKDFTNKPHLIHMNDVANGKEKIRIADFIGSINATEAEVKEGKARLFAELYRDNEAHKVIDIDTHLAKMKMGYKKAGALTPSVGSGPPPPMGTNQGYMK